MGRSPSVTEVPAKRWGDPFARLDAAWCRLEMSLAVAVLVAEIATLVVWVSLKGLAANHGAGNPIGLIFRGIATMIVLGALAHVATRRASPTVNRAAVMSASLLGIFAGRLWTGLGVDWSSNIVEWLQNASGLALIGGPRGLVTRLTLWLALLGAALAASRGKHINVDVLTRFMPARMIMPVSVIGAFATALVCFAAAFGFVDSIAVTKYRAEAFEPCPPGDQRALCDTPVGDRLAMVSSGMRSDFFLLRRQVALDLRTLPHVLVGDPYDGYLDGATWNEWVKGGGWEDYFPKDAVQSLYAPTDDPKAFRMPAVTAPDTGEGRNLLIRDLNFVLPFGLLVIGLKFLLRIVLLLSGHARSEGHGEGDLPAHEAEPKGASA